MINPKEIRAKLAHPQWGARGTNASLWLDKYIEEQRRDDTGSRRNLIEGVSTLPEPVEYRLHFERWQELLKSSYNADLRRVKVKGRMIVGLGNESVLETSICLQRTYGLPYIPGSALKGLAANYAHHYMDEDWRRGGKLHTIVFGDTDDAGYITFFDALYMPGSGHRGRALYPDIITVHHQEYYQSSGKAPSERDDPNPIPLLSATGDYLFALAAPDFQGSTRWTELTFMILAEALKTSGVGAKTSSGYGRMEFLDPPVKPLDPEILIAQKYQREIEKMREQDVAGQIPGYHRKWQQLASPEARKIVAQAIIEKIRLAKREKASADKAWYREVLEFLDR